MDILYLLKVLLRRIWIILSIPLIAGLTAYFFTKDIERQYKSTSQISTGFTSSDQGPLSSDQRFNYRESVLKFNNMIETMNTEIVVSMLSYNLLIHDLKEATPFRTRNITVNNKEQIIEILEFKIENFELLSSVAEEEKIINDLLISYGYANWIIKQELKIKRIGETDFIKVETQTENPYLSAYIVNVLAEEYIRFYNYAKVSSNDQSFLFYTNLVNEKKNYLDQKTSELNSFKNESNIYNYGIESQSNLMQIADYERQRQEQQNEVYSLKKSFESISKKVNSFDNSQNANNSKILSLRSKINELNQIYIENGSKDKQLEASIENLRSQLQVELARISEIQNDQQEAESMSSLITQREDIRLELNIAESKLASLNSTIASLRSKVSQIGSKEATLLALGKEVENATEEYLKAVDKANEAKSKLMVVTNTIKLMVRGQPNGYPVSSKAYMIIALGVFATGGLCVFVIIAIEFMDLRIKTPERFENFTSLKLSGIINDIQVKGLNLVELFKDNNLEDKKLETYKHFVRKIRHEIDTSSAQSFLVTSTVEGSGKSFSILSISYSLSLINKQILIIDTNFRNNSLTKILLAKYGIQNLITEHADVKLLTGPDMEEKEDGEFMDNIISSTGIKSIDIIGSKVGISSPSEVFAGRNFHAIMEYLKTKYDYIFLEGAALNEYSDTKELISFVDRVIPVFSAENSIHQMDKDSLRYLKSLEGKLLGAILNKVDTKNLL